MKIMTQKDINAAIAYAINPHGSDYAVSEKNARDFELGARRMLDYLVRNDFVTQENNRKSA